MYQVLGRPRGLRIGETPERYGQYFHYLAMWMYALHVLAEVKPGYPAIAVQLVKDVHGSFAVPGRGVIWKMREDLNESWTIVQRERSLHVLERLWRGHSGYFARDLREPDDVFALRTMVW